MWCISTFLLEPQIRQDLNRLDPVVLAAQDPLMISEMFSASSLLVLKSRSCLKLVGMFSFRLSVEARKGPNFEKVALIVRNLYLRARVDAQDAL